jgi:hypothetical protein
LSKKFYGYLMIKLEIDGQEIFIPSQLEVDQQIIADPEKRKEWVRSVSDDDMFRMAARVAGREHQARSGVPLSNLGRGRVRWTVATIVPRHDPI